MRSSKLDEEAPGPPTAAVLPAQQTTVTAEELKAPPSLEDWVLPRGAHRDKGSLPGQVEGSGNHCALLGCQTVNVSAIAI